MQIKTKLRNHKLKLNSTINITPFVDVLLILLIVFMVTAPNLNTGFEVELPKASNVNNVENKNTNITITVSSSNIFFNDKKINLSALKQNLSAFNSKNTQIFLKADANVQYQRVISILNELTTLGFVNISLLAEP